MTFRHTFPGLALLLALAGPTAQAQAAGQSGAGSAAAAQDPLEPLLARAQAALDRNDFPGAIALLRQIVAARPSDALPHFELGYCYSQLKQDQDAIVEFRRAIELNGDLAAAHLNLGLLLRDSDPTAAAASFQRAAALTPADGRPHFLAASALEKAGKSGEALAEYQSAATLAPNDATIRVALGRALLAKGRGADAEAEFRAAGNSGGASAASLGLAESLLQQKKSAEAAEQFALYLKETPSDRGARFESAVALQNAGRLTESLAQLDRIEQNEPPSADTLKLRGGIYLQQKNWAAAVGPLDKAIAALPGDAELYAWEGHARLNLHDYPAAESALSHSLAIDPSAIAPLRDLVNVRYFSNQCAAAMQSLDLLTQTMPTLPLDWFFRATCYDKLKQVQAAVTAYQKFLDADAGALPDQELSARLRLNLLMRELQKSSKARKK